jgi:outer membrane protein assembly factor BamB
MNVPIQLFTDAWRMLLRFALPALVVAFSLSAAHGAWPQFRGPDGQGRSDATGLPLNWSENKNIKWQTALHGRAWSSPVILDRQIWVTSATEDGRELFAICVDRDSGKIIHDLKLFDVENPQFAIRFNTYASPTPVIEPGRVYVTFGSPGTACLDTETGKVLWERRDFECNHFRGAGSSPIIHENLLIMHFDGSDHQFVVALDKATGKTVWRTERSIDFQDLDANGKPAADGDYRKAFATPHVALFNGEPLLISFGAKAAYGYNPRTGEELWRVEERSTHSASTRPVIGDNLIYFPSGFATAQLLAIRPGGRGLVTDSHVAWRVRRSIPNKPSPVLKDGLLFMIHDGGTASCIDANTGAEIWQERVGGNYSASPLYADGRIYFFSEEGKTTVIEAGREFKKLAENQLGDGFLASPAVSGKALFLRSRTHLYRVEQ